MSEPLSLLRHRTASRTTLLVAASLLGACNGGTGATDGTVDMAAAASPDLSYVSTDPIIVARPYEWLAPSTLDPARPAPLLIALHGYRSNPFLVNALFKMDTHVEAGGYLYVNPAATPDKDNNPRWNVDADPMYADDVAYIDAIIADMSRRFRVDPKRVFVLGHSNGSAMAYRYGCERSDRVAAIVPIAGLYSSDPARCAPPTPVAVLDVVGDMDNWPGNPPRRDTVAFWANLDGCSPTSDLTAPPIDLIEARAGAETVVEKWTGCRSGTAVESWVVHGADHHPGFNKAWAPAVWTWLAAHPRP